MPLSTLQTMRLATLVLPLLAGCSAAPTTPPPTPTMVDLSAAPDAGAHQPQMGAPDASAPPAETAAADAPEAPAEVPGKATLTQREIKLANKIHFEFDRPDIRAESLPLLDAVATLLLSHPKVTVEIQCHSDNRGSNAHNLELTQGRADALLRYLTGRGVLLERMKAVGYGASRPITHAPPQQLRRCEFVRTDVR